jgi:hypothetical protein
LKKFLSILFISLVLSYTLLAQDMIATWRDSSGNIARTLPKLEGTYVNISGMTVLFRYVTQNNDYFIYNTADLNNAIYFSKDGSKFKLLIVDTGEWYYYNFVSADYVMSPPQPTYNYNYDYSPKSSPQSNIPELCYTCHGLGRCEVCRGSGIYSMYGQSSVCSGCDGDGKCWHCHGSGKQ